MRIVDSSNRVYTMRLSTASRLLISFLIVVLLTVSCAAKTLDLKRVKTVLKTVEDATLGPSRRLQQLAWPALPDFVPGPELNSAECLAQTEDGNCTYNPRSLITNAAPAPETEAGKWVAKIIGHLYSCELHNSTESCLADEANNCTLVVRYSPVNDTLVSTCTLSSVARTRLFREYTVCPGSMMEKIFKCDDLQVDAFNITDFFNISTLDDFFKCKSGNGLTCVNTFGTCLPQEVTTAYNLTTPWAPGWDDLQSAIQDASETIWGCCPGRKVYAEQAACLNKTQNACSGYCVWVPDYHRGGKGQGGRRYSSPPTSQGGSSSAERRGNRGSGRPMDGQMSRMDMGWSGRRLEGGVAGQGAGSAVGAGSYTGRVLKQFGGSVENSTVPVDGSTTPGENSTLPGDGSAGPGDGYTGPGYNGTQPDDGSTSPDDGDDGYTVPGYNSSMPGDGSMSPGDGDMDQYEDEDGYCVLGNFTIEDVVLTDVNTDFAEFIRTAQAKCASSAAGSTCARQTPLPAVSETKALRYAQLSITPGGGTCASATPPSTSTRTGTAPTTGTGAGTVPTTGTGTGAAPTTGTGTGTQPTTGTGTGTEPTTSTGTGMDPSSSSTNVTETTTGSGTGSGAGASPASPSVPTIIAGSPDAAVTASSSANTQLNGAANSSTRAANAPGQVASAGVVAFVPGLMVTGAAGVVVVGLLWAGL